MTTIDKRVGQRIAELRRLAGLSQAQLADKVGTATETISRLETGAAMPSLARLGSIAQVLGVELYELLRLGSQGDQREKALERLRWMMSRRTVGEIDLVVSIAASALDHLDRHRDTSTRGR
jgi:transcriptional regulator with XRE-family HTH domain